MATTHVLRGSYWQRRVVPFAPLPHLEATMSLPLPPPQRPRRCLRCGIHLREYAQHQWYHQDCRPDAGTLGLPNGADWPGPDTFLGLIGDPVLPVVEAAE